MKRRQGFTLAEVLITLGIIGLVAIVTIPELLSNSGSGASVAGYKKALSELNQTVTMSIALDYISYADVTDGVGDTSLYDLLKKRLDLESSVITGTEDEASRVSKMFGADALTSNYTIFINDGIAISYPKTAKNCTTKNPCKIVIDVNGIKQPNALSHCQKLDLKDTTRHDKDDIGYCADETLFIGDQFSIRLGTQQALPNGQAARQVLFKK